MVNYGDLQFAERIMVARRSEMSAEWKVRFAICIASVAIQAFTKLLFSFSDVLKTTNCTFQEVDNIFWLAVGIEVYDEFFSCMCAAEFLCALDVFARHTSSRITFLTWNVIWKREVTTMRALTIVLTKQVVLTEKTSSNIKKRTRTTECHLSSHTILPSVIYPASFVSTGQPYKNTQNCVKSSKNHPSWPSGNPKVWKTSWWELTSPLDLPTMVSVKNLIRDDVWRAKTSNTHIHDHSLSLLLLLQ